METDGDEPFDDEIPPPPFHIKDMKLAAVFPPTVTPEIDPPIIESLEFHREGRLLISVDNQSDILQIDVETGEIIKRFSSGKKYPIGLCRYTHHPQSILCSSRKTETENNLPNGHDIRYLSLHDNSYQRFFQGHTAEVISLAMSPCDDNFASGSKDGSVRLWNLKSSQSTAILNLPPKSGSPFVAYDPTGKVFAITFLTENSSHIVKLFDAKNYSTGPFATFTIEHTEVANFVSGVHSSVHAETLGKAEWNNLLFSPDESYILVSTKNDGLFFLLDAFDGTLLRCFSHEDFLLTHPSSNMNGNYLYSGHLGHACFTPDGAYVVAGTDNGKVCFWSIHNKTNSKNNNNEEDNVQENGDNMSDEDKEEIKLKEIEHPSHVLEAHTSTVGCVACSPTLGVVASSCSVVALWTDSQPHDEEKDETPLNKPISNESHEDDELVKTEQRTEDIVTPLTEQIEPVAIDEPAMKPGQGEEEESTQQAEVETAIGNDEEDEELEEEEDEPLEE